MINKNDMDSLDSNGLQNIIDESQQVKQRLLSNRQSQTVLNQIEFDEALEKVGASKWYQFRAFLIFGIEWFIAAFILLCGPFIFPSANYTNNDCPGDQKCTKNIICALPANQQAQYIDFGQGDNHVTFTEYYSLYCSNEWKATLISSIGYLGSFLGFTIFPLIADNVGRRPALMASWGICTIGCLMMSAAWFKDGFWLMFIGYFIAGFGVNPAITLHYSFLNEHSLGNFREYTSIAVQVLYSFGELFFVLIAYLCSNDFYIAIFAFTLPTFLMNFSILFVFESPKFVYERDTLKAINILNQIAVVNKREKLEVNAMKSLLKQQNQKTYTVVDLFRYKSLSLLSYAASMIFFCIQAVYYGVTFTMGNVGLSIYTNIAIISSAEALAYSVTNSIIPSLPRKWTCVVGLSLTSAIALSFLLFETPDNCKNTMCTQKILQIVFAALMRFCISFTWTVVYIYFSELFPTVVRSLALGFTSTAGTLGSFGAPYLISACNNGNVNPMMILGFVALVGAGHVLFLKETKGQPLENNIRELTSEYENGLITQSDPNISDPNEQR